MSLANRSVSEFQFTCLMPNIGSVGKARYIPMPCAARAKRIDVALNANNAGGALTVKLQKLTVDVTDSELSIAVAANEGSREFTPRDGSEFFEQDEACRVTVGGTSTLADKGWVTITFERA